MNAALGNKSSKPPAKSRGALIAVIALVLLVAALVLGAVAVQMLRPKPESAGMEKAHLVRVVDGDTIVVKLGGEQQKVRFVGIDAPESVASDESRNLPEGEQASDHLKGLVKEGQVLYLEKDVSDTDKYGRLLRYVWVEAPENPDNTDEIAEKMLGGIMVAHGYAEARTWEPDHAHEKALRKLMERAIAAGAGVSYLWNE